MPLLLLIVEWFAWLARLRQVSPEFKIPFRSQVYSLTQGAGSVGTTFISHQAGGQTVDADAIFFRLIGGKAVSPLLFCPA